MFYYDIYFFVQGADSLSEVLEHEGQMNYTGLGQDKRTPHSPFGKRKSVPNTEDSKVCSCGFFMRIDIPFSIFHSLRLGSRDLRSPVFKKIVSPNLKVLLIWRTSLLLMFAKIVMRNL